MNGVTHFDLAVHNHTCMVVRYSRVEGISFRTGVSDTTHNGVLSDLLDSYSK